jgi:hypothetical protein
VTLYSTEHTRLLKALVEYKVKFLLIGGHAAIFYGVHRNTGDLDILVQPTVENGLKIIQALESLNMELPEIHASEFEKSLILSFGLEPDAVDILNYTPGIIFEAAYAKSRNINFQGIDVLIMDIEDLIHNKESLSRDGAKALLDKYDVEVLKKILKSQK